MEAKQRDQEPTWEELMGSNEWKGLLSPLHLKLRHLILRCGDLVQATGDAFISDSKSKYHGWSRYGKKSFFHDVMFPFANENYDVEAFLYATSGYKVFDVFGDWETNWMGYIAVTKDEVSKANGRREIYVAWRGSVRRLEWLDDLEADLVPAKPLLRPGNDDEGAKIMKGWLTVYTSQNPNSLLGKTSARNQVQTKIKELLEKYKDEDVSLIFTGHSLGGALAVLSAFDVVENQIASAKISVAAFVHACPMLGNEAFCNNLAALDNLRILHIKNGQDKVPNYPGTDKGFSYAGIVVPIDMSKSPYLKSSLGVGENHNLQGYLHIVAGWNGGNQAFDLKVWRSLPLVNKDGDLLNTEHQVPASWWVVENKGMVRGEDGKWTEQVPPDPEF